MIIKKAAGLILSGALAFALMPASAAFAETGVFNQTLPSTAADHLHY